jgi:hypothetical protein
LSSNRHCSQFFPPIWVVCHFIDHVESLTWNAVPSVLSLERRRPHDAGASTPFNLEKTSSRLKGGIWDQVELIELWPDTLISFPWKLLEPVKTSVFQSGVVGVTGAKAGNVTIGVCVAVIGNVIVTQMSPSQRSSFIWE